VSQGEQSVLGEIIRRIVEVTQPGRITLSGSAVREEMEPIHRCRSVEPILIDGRMYFR